MKESQFLGQTTEELTLVHGECRERIIQKPEKNNLETLQGMYHQYRKFKENTSFVSSQSGSQGASNKPLAAN